MPPTTHAVLGASSSERWMACPGSVRMSHGRPDDTSVYAIEGSAAHELGERCLRDGQDADAYLGQVIPVPEEQEDGATEIHQIEVTEDMTEAVQVYVDYARNLVTEASDEAVQYVERQFDLSPLNPPEAMYGTGDHVLWDPGSRVLDVTDYKHGQGVAVDAVENSQLRYYALGAVLELRVKPETIRMTIVQPRGHHPDGTIRSDEITWDELVGFKRELFAAAERTQEPDAPLVPGEHCRFCRALAVCSAQQEYAVQVAQSEFESFTPPAPEELTPTDMAMVLAAAGRLKGWLHAVEAHALNILDKGGEVPGWKLVEGRKGNRKWTDEEAADTYLKGQGFKVGERYKPRVLVSPTQAAKLLKKEGKEVPDRLISRSDGRPKLAPQEDSRPALPPSAEQDFDTVSEPENPSHNATE